MKPEFEDSGEELSILIDEDSADVLEGSAHSGPNEREAQPKVDANFFNNFEDDCDESDMVPPTA